MDLEDTKPCVPMSSWPGLTACWQWHPSRSNTSSQRMWKGENPGGRRRGVKSYIKYLEMKLTFNALWSRWRKESSLEMTRRLAKPLLINVWSRKHISPRTGYLPTLEMRVFFFQRFPAFWLRSGGECFRKCSTRLMCVRTAGWQGRVSYIPKCV